MKTILLMDNHLAESQLLFLKSLMHMVLSPLKKKMSIAKCHSIRFYQIDVIL